MRAALAFAFLALSMSGASAETKPALWNPVMMPSGTAYMRPTALFFERVKRETCPTATSDLFRACCMENADILTAEWKKFDEDAQKPILSTTVVGAEYHRSELMRRFDALSGRTDALAVKFPSSCNFRTK
jgi:hypothetical protein